MSLVRRIASAAALLVFVAVPLLAQDEAKRRFLVGTWGTAKTAALPGVLAGREVHRFRSIDGFAVEMTEAEAEALRRSGEVRFVEPDYERYAAAIERMPQELTWGIQRVRAPELWPLTRGGRIRVGVLDTGIAFTHDDLRADHPGRSRALLHPPRGWDFADDDPDPTDDMSHGTHVAGIIAAADDAAGVIGAAGEVDLYALRVMKEKNGVGTGSVSDIIDAVDWAIEHDLRILNLSFTSDNPSIAEREAFDRAEAAGILSIAATGNRHDPAAPVVGYPAGYPSVLAVGAIDERNEVADFSQRGAEIDLVAPGVEILSTVLPGNGPGELTEITAPDGTVFFAFLMEGAPHGLFEGQIVPCGIGRPEEFPESVRGNIALVRRGELFFQEKVRNAKAAGAVAVILYNSDESWFEGTLIRTPDGEIDPELASYPWITAVTVSGEIGEYLAGNGGPGAVRSGFWPNHRSLSGTSMAAPHVVAVAALVWSLRPEATAAEVRTALIAGAVDLGTPGWDVDHGHGLVDAAGAAHVLAPELTSPLASPRRAPAAPAR
ncbi:MAG: S8 family serine peptidase [Thermoanaerobaculia bacterium]